MENDRSKYFDHRVWLVLVLLSQSLLFLRLFRLRKVKIIDPKTNDTIPFAIPLYDHARMSK